MQRWSDPHDLEQAIEPLHDGRTARLSLRRPTDADVAELFLMYSDRRVWQDDPLLRHTSVAQTNSWVERWAAGWRRHGLGPWVLRTLHGPSAGNLVGVGGCSLPTTTAWNLAFSLRPEVWGQGYAQEVAAAGWRCARVLRPDIPITAVVAARNTRSRRAIERAGLSSAWRGPDNKDTDPKAELLLYADRVLSEEQVRVLTA